MRILHTSDWHLGAQLYGRKRHNHHADFLQWLLKQLMVGDVLLISGDIFDSSTPGNRSMELYYTFLKEAVARSIRVVITGGNHDSPSFLNASSGLLKSMNIHVIGGQTDDPAQQIIPLMDEEGTPVCLILAVPYLRDRDIRQSQSGESWEEKQHQLAQGIQNHYRRLMDLTLEQYPAATELPIIAMGHLFVTGASPGDGVRDLYVGNLGQMNLDLFPHELDYLALGHLHVPQKLGSHGKARYSGSPIPMGFNEIDQLKELVLLELEGRSVRQSTLEIPSFQEMKRIKGDTPELIAQLERLKRENSQAWLELHYTGSSPSPLLKEELENLIIDSQLDICRIINTALPQLIQQPQEEMEDLEELDSSTIFQRCLEQQEIPEEEWQEYNMSFQEILHAMTHKDEREDD